MKKILWTSTHEELERDCGPLFGAFGLSYLAESFVDEHLPDLSSVKADVQLHLSVWSMPSSLVWLDSQENPFQRAVNVGQEVTDSLFRVLGLTTGLAEVVAYDDEVRTIVKIPSQISLTVICEVEQNSDNIICKATLKNTEDRYFWTQETRKHRLERLDWAKEPGDTGFTAIFL